MDLRAKCAAVIPCFNEQATIASVAQLVRPQVCHVIVIDDGSTDGSATEAKSSGAEVIRHESNQGKGQALRTGMIRARDLNFEWVLTVDADGQHAADDIPKFFDCVHKTAAKLVVGNRMTAADRMPWLRRVVNRWMSRRLSSAAGQRFPNSQYCFRLVDLPAWFELR